jgi:hypothetical protein
MDFMIDAVVLIHSLGVETGRIDEHSRHWESARTSHDLVEHADAMTMSAINWFEALRGMDGPQRDVLAKWRGHIKILPVDSRVSARAAEIYAAARKSGKVCPKCFAFLKALQCDACGNHRSEPQRSNDIVMVATADVVPEVRVLYSWDKGVLALGEHVSDVEVKNPPPPRAQQINLDGTSDIRSARRKKNKDRGR